MPRCPIVAISAMNPTYLRTRQISLALLVTAVVEQRQAPSVTDVCSPHSSSKLLDLGRELIRTRGSKRLSCPR